VIDTAVLEQIHNAVAVVSWALEPEASELDVAAGEAIEELSGAGSDTVAAFASLTTALLARLARATERSAGSLLQDLALSSAKLGDSDG
jgi:hypothetical protein